MQMREDYSLQRVTSILNHFKNFSIFLLNTLFLIFVIFHKYKGTHGIGRQQLDSSHKHETLRFSSHLSKHLLDNNVKYTQKWSNVVI